MLQRHGNTDAQFIVGYGNTEVNGSAFNVEFCHADIKAVYHQLFDEALERYNAKQKRSDRNIEKQNDLKGQKQQIERELEW